MPLLAKDVDDVGKLGLGGFCHHVGSGRAILSHPHIERAVEPERKAAIALVELHRGHADIHHDTVDGCDTLGCADLRQIGKAILDQGQPAVEAVHEIKPAGDRGAVAVDADDLRSRDLQQHPAIAAGAEGGVDINATGARCELLDRFAAEHRDVTRGVTIWTIGRGHAPAPLAKRVLPGKCDANGPIAPQMPAFGETFPLERPQPDRRINSPRPNSRGSCPKTPVSARNLVGCHGSSSGQTGASAVPKPVRRFTT